MAHEHSHGLAGRVNCKLIGDANYLSSMPGKTTGLDWFAMEKVVKTSPCEARICIHRRRFFMHAVAKNVYNKIHCLARGVNMRIVADEIRNAIHVSMGY